MASSTPTTSANVVLECTSVGLYPSSTSRSSAPPTSAYVSIRQHTSAYVSIRQHTSAYTRPRRASPAHLLRLLRQYLYFFTSKASKLSTYDASEEEEELDDVEHKRHSHRLQRRYSVYLLYSYKSTDTDTTSCSIAASHLQEVFVLTSVYQLDTYVCTSKASKAMLSTKRHSHSHGYNVANAVSICTFVLVQQVLLY